MGYRCGIPVIWLGFRASLRTSISVEEMGNGIEFRPMAGFPPRPRGPYVLWGLQVEARWATWGRVVSNPVHYILDGGLDGGLEEEKVTRPVAAAVSTGFNNLKLNQL